MIHGTRTAYNHYQCCCVKCVTANRVYHRGLRAELRPREIPAGRHGIRSTYTNWGCRCDQCTEAAAGYYLRWKAAR